MARRSQSSSQGDNPLDPNYLPPHYKEYYRLALDLLAEEGKESYHRFLAEEAAPDFLCPSEVEHITQHLQKPQCVSQEGGGSTDSGPLDADMDGSSGTYWPVNSDLAIPELDLGWPMVFGFRGTEVTTLVQPPPPDNPSIKEEARRMIRAAQQVVAIVMDIFTDVDLLSEVLDVAARRVPVYILLDEMHAQLFLDMAAKCRVNLNFVEFLRVRTVSGPTYYCRTGMSFKGHLKEKFLLVDCMVVLSGSYSFMWSFEKIHRSIAHIFQGELVASFDEEFRILFAQSDPLVPPSNILVRTEAPVGPYSMATLGNNMPFFPKKPHLLFPREDNLFSPFMDRVDPDRYFLSSFRRDDMLRHTLEGSTMRMYSKKMEMENCQADPVRGYLRSKQLEMDSFKRHSFAEGTFENFQSTKQFSKQLYMNNLDEFKIQSSHFQKDQFYQYQFEHPHGANRPQGLFERIRGGRLGFNEPEDYADGFRCPELESNFPQDGHPLRLDYVPSNSSKEVRHGSDHLNPGGNGLLGLPSLRRQNMGQKFICQTSPTQKQSMEQRLFCTTKAKMWSKTRRFRRTGQGCATGEFPPTLVGISLTQEREGLPMPMEPLEMHNEVLGPPEPLTRYPSDLLPTFKPPLPLPNAKDISGSDRLPEESSVVKQDPFRSRINPLIQRSSRLRSSLIFSAAKLDQPNSSTEKVQMVQKEQTSTETIKDAETIKASTVSKVAELLEKYKSVGKDSQSTTLSHTKAMSAFLQKESQNAERKCTKSVQYKILESQVLDSKDSFSPYKLHPESEEQFAGSASATDLLSPMVHGSSKTDKLASRFYPIDQSSLPEKESLIFVGETQKLAIADKKENVSFKGGDGFETEEHKPAQAPVSTISSKNQGSDSTLSKPDEESCKQEQSPREFFRKGSLKLKQLLNPKAEKKADEETGLESWRPDKLGAGALKRVSRSDSQEITEEEKSPKPATPVPALRANPAPQSRLLPSSTANVLYSSNLRDDTKVILEQISANSQKNRAELARQLPAASNPELSRSVTSLDRKGDERNTGISRSESFGSHKRCLQREPSEDRDSLLKRMESMRKEKRVYSRFEVFCKKEEQGEEECETDAKDKKMGKFMPKLLGSFKTKK